MLARYSRASVRRPSDKPAGSYARSTRRRVTTWTTPSGLFQRVRFREGAPIFGGLSTLVELPRALSCATYGCLRLMRTAAAIRILLQDSGWSPHLISRHVGVLRPHSC